MGRPPLPTLPLKLKGRSVVRWHSSQVIAQIKHYAKTAPQTAFPRNRLVTWGAPGTRAIANFAEVLCYAVMLLVSPTVQCRWCSIEKAWLLKGGALWIHVCMQGRAGQGRVKQECIHVSRAPQRQTEPSSISKAQVWMQRTPQEVRQA